VNPVDPAASRRVFPDPRQQRPGRLSSSGTAVFGLLWLTIVIHGWSPVVEYDPIWWLQLPAASAERMTNRDLELSEAITASGPLARRALELLYATRGDTLARSIDVQRELLFVALEQGLPLEDEDSLAAVRARLAVLLAEAGELAEARQAAKAVDTTDSFAAALDAAYGGGDVIPEAEHLFRTAGLSGWYLARARSALARAEGHAERATAIDAELQTRGTRWKLRTTSITAVNLGLVVLGGLLIATHLKRVRQLFGKSLAPPTWTFGDGIGVFVRGDFWNRAYFVSISSLDQIPGIGPALASSPAGELLQTWATLIAAMPLLWLVHRHLLVPNGLTARTAFGLELLPRSLGIGVAAIAVDLAGTYALAFATWGLGVESSWTEGFDETLIWGSGAGAWLTTIDYVVWAPTFEELAFRGILFYTLRHRLGPTTAALSTATFFAAMHFYSLPGFLMTLWSGVVWAIAFERARSLLPGLVAHAVYNGLYVLGIVLLYR
jgi:membrane protease YdiL (CAAX protease family)